MTEFKYIHWGETVDLSEMKGIVFTSIIGLEKESDEVIFNTSCGRQFKMYHEQCCCESVWIEDVCGDVGDLINSQVVHFEERTNEGDEESDNKPNEYCESFTWTFYDIQTLKGCVTVRWLGESNGYYSESVDIVEGEKC